MYVQYSELTFEESFYDKTSPRVFNNSAKEGSLVKLDLGSKITITNISFVRNNASNSLIHSTISSVVFTNCTFSENHSTLYGVFYISSSSTLTVLDSVVKKNTGS